MEVVKVKNIDELKTVLDNDRTYELDYTEFEIQDDNIGKDKIITQGLPYFIKDFGLLIIEGEYCNHETGNGEDEFVPDWSLTLVYNWCEDRMTFDQEDAHNYMYFEQDPPIIAIHNYLRTIEDFST